MDHMIKDLTLDIKNPDNNCGTSFNLGNKLCS